MLTKTKIEGSSPFSSTMPQTINGLLVIDLAKAIIRKMGLKFHASARLYTKTRVPKTEIK